jgi:hypothetical protein
MRSKRIYEPPPHCSIKQVPKMPRTRISRLQGVECGGYVPASITPSIQRTLSQLQIAPPPRGYAIPMAVLDAALEGRSIHDRIEIKSLLRAHSLINN